MKYNSSRIEYKGDLEQFMLGQFVFDLNRLYAHYEDLRDHPKARGVRYCLPDVLTLITLAKLGGEDGPTGMAEWLAHRAEVLVRALALERQTRPHRVTISRILGQAVQVEELEQVLQRYFDAQAQLSQAVVIAIDGKTLRGTIPVGQTQGVHLLAAYLPEEGLVLMEVEVETKQNEIVVAPKLLHYLDVRDKVVIADAMHTQRKLSIEVVTAGDDFVWIAKQTQPEVQATIADLFEPEPVTPGFAPTQPDFQTAIMINKGHGRLERQVLTSSGMLKDYLEWPYLEQVFRLERRFINLSTGVVTTETHYGLTSLTPTEADPDRLPALQRTYWGLENGWHYRRDVTLQEDRCRLKIGHATRTMATLNNLVLTLILRQGFAYLPEARQRYAARPLDALQLIMENPYQRL
jgi:predicted transposase YbfD/YdcC